MKKQRVLSFVLAVLLLLSLSQSAAAGANTEQLERDVIALVNNERNKAGLAPLQYAEDLADAADVRAKEIVQKFAHERPDGTSCLTAFPSAGYCGFGENIAWGQRTPEEVMDCWMNSPGHRENILRPEFTHIGVGCHEDGGRLYWVQTFGASDVVVPLLGDANLDGMVDAGDAVLVLRHDAKLTTLTGQGLANADANRDGIVDAGDAVLILRFDAGLITEI